MLRLSDFENFLGDGACHQTPLGGREQKLTLPLKVAPISVSLQVWHSALCLRNLHGALFKLNYLVPVLGIRPPPPPPPHTHTHTQKSWLRACRLHVVKGDSVKAFNFTWVWNTGLHMQREWIWADRRGNTLLGKCFLNCKQCLEASRDMQLNFFKSSLTNSFLIM